MRNYSLARALFPKTRQAVLASTLMQPARWWYLADLARHIGVTSSSLQREMASLVQAGILLRRQEGRQVYFKPDPECPIYHELQAIIAKTVGLVDVLVACLAPFAGAIRIAFIYGSIARGEALSESDVDLMIVGETGLAELSPALRAAEDRLGRAINPTLYSRKEFAEKLGQGNHFLRTACDGEKIFIIGDKDDLAAASRR